MAANAGYTKNAFAGRYLLSQKRFILVLRRPFRSGIGLFVFRLRRESIRNVRAIFLRDSADDGRFERAFEPHGGYHVSEFVIRPVRNRFEVFVLRIVKSPDLGRKNEGNAVAYAIGRGLEEVRDLVIRIVRRAPVRGDRRAEGLVEITFCKIFGGGAVNFVFELFECRIGQQRPQAFENNVIIVVIVIRGKLLGCKHLFHRRQRKQRERLRMGFGEIDALRFVSFLVGVRCEQGVIVTEFVHDGPEVGQIPRGVDKHEAVSVSGERGNETCIHFGVAHREIV